MLAQGYKTVKKLAARARIRIKAHSSQILIKEYF